MSNSLPRLAAALADRYHVIRELGAGGMATVYLAEDLKHHRHVAVKVLHPELAAVLGAERFLAEIRTTANLQHPHILPLHDSGQADGLLYYVMPYVEGESLRQRLSRERQLPVEAAVRITREVASALDYAHRHGVIHRDIKPENILLHEEQALIADFGIALAVSSAGGQRMTQTGMSLGTPEYMSPEQAMGERVITAKSDVYALGCVLYEMLTGEPPFTGATVQAVVARTLNEEPRPIRGVRKTVPPHVEAATIRALAKLPADRVGSAGEFAAELASASSGPDRAVVPAGAPAAAPWWRWGAVGMAGLAVALVVGLLRERAQATAAPTIRVALAGVEVWGDRVMALAPEGRGFASCGTSGWSLRAWGQLAPVPLRGLRGCWGAAFSPDGRQLAVLGSLPVLQVFSTTGGAPPRVIADTGLGDPGSFGAGIDWATEDRIYLAVRTGLLRVSVSTGSQDVLVPGDSALGRFTDLDVLPSERAAVVTVSPPRSTGLADLRIGVVQFDTRRFEPLLEGVAARYLPTGHLLVVATDGTMRAFPFDASAQKLTGEGVALRDTVLVGANGDVNLGVTADGTLLYRRREPEISQIVLVDRKGTAREVIPGWNASFAGPRLAPDGNRVAVTAVSEGIEQVWVADLRSGERTAVARGGLASRQEWSPDGQTLYFISDQMGAARVHQVPAAGGKPIVTPTSDPRPIFGIAFTADGRLLLRTDNQAAGKGDILVIEPGRDSAATDLVADPDFSEFAPSASPDGRWLAYTSDEAGPFEIFVRPLDNPARERWQVSTEGGTEPRWTSDGRELLFRARDTLFAATVGGGAAFTMTAPRPVLGVGDYLSFYPFGKGYDVTRDGQQFLMLRRIAKAGAMVAVFNWFEEVKSLARKD